MSVLTQTVLSCNGAFPAESPDSSDSIFNRVELHRAEIPAANGITNARALARIYARLIGDINEDGRQQPRLISENTLLRATTSVTPAGEPDLVLFGATSNFARGGFHAYSNFFKAFGVGVFGHKGRLEGESLIRIRPMGGLGMGGSCALAYPVQQLSYAHVCNHLDFSSPTLDPRSVRLVQAIESVLNSAEMPAIKSSM